jgi:hypothetical protein
VVSNDPYHDGWLDEGMTDLATTLYLNDVSYDDQRFRPNAKPSDLPLSELSASDIVASLYAQPEKKFNDLLDTYGDGRDMGFTFLSAYWTAYKNHQLDTKEFVRFTKTFFGMKNDDFFNWLKLGGK